MERPKTCIIAEVDLADYYEKPTNKFLTYKEVMIDKPVLVLEHLLAGLKDGTIQIKEFEAKIDIDEGLEVVDPFDLFRNLSIRLRTKGHETEQLSKVANV